jgi:hypothetical protein
MVGVEEPFCAILIRTPQLIAYLPIHAALNLWQQLTIQVTHSSNSIVPSESFNGSSDRIDNVLMADFLRVIKVRQVYGNSTTVEMNELVVLFSINVPCIATASACIQICV